jgi:adenosylcobyric acid synthase
MALNSFVTRDGLEMGRAQVVQAQAAGMEPDVRMNPILLKPSSDTGSQVIVNGEVRGQMPAAAYFKMKRTSLPPITVWPKRWTSSSLRELAARPRST